jgi:hypothetical protein
MNMSNKITNAVKILVAAVALVTAAASPSLAQRAPQQDGSGGYYHGYPLNEWHTQDGY